MEKPDNLIFTPGAGISPPVLAGRDKEKATITTVLDGLATGLCPAENIALIGPRGNGKTALMKWVKAQVGSYNGKVDCVELNAKYFESNRDLVAALSDRGVLSSLADQGVSAKIKFPGSEIDFSPQEAAGRLLRSVLEKRCSKNGLAILIDEAHTLSDYKHSARGFFNDVQSIAGDGRPLLLILAGTPNISTRLATIEATFWNRLKKIGVGLLDDAAAHEALRVPLKWMGYTIEADALDRAANEAQCYPYFLQLVGAALHRVAREEPDKLGSGNGIGGAILAQALKEFEIATNSYYDERYRELQWAGVLPAAEAVARRFVSQEAKSISAAAFEVSVSRSIDSELKSLAKERGGINPAAWVQAELRDFGLVWSPIGHEASCEAGIPSLMNYILERADDLERELSQI